jgi:hypothetical protein
MVQVNQDGLKLNGTHQLLVYAIYVNILGRSIHTTEKNTYALVIASTETGLEMMIKLRTQSCLQIRMLDEVAVQRMIIVLLKGSMSSNICKQPSQIKILLRKKLRAE